MQTFASTWGGSLMDPIETVNGYPVLAQRPGHKKTSSTYETIIVLCWRKGHPDPFVTWEYVLSEPAQPNYAISGNYFSSPKEAGIDFEARYPGRR